MDRCIRPARLHLRTKSNEVHGGIDIGSQSFAEIGIEIRQSSAVDYQVDGSLQSFACVQVVHSQSGLADVSLHDFDLFLQKCAEIPAVTFVQAIEGWRLLDDLFKSSLRRGGAISAESTE